MEIRRTSNGVAKSRWVWTALVSLSALLLVVGLSLGLVRLQALALSSENSSVSSPVAQTTVVTAQIRSPSRNAYITQKSPMTIKGIAWREGAVPPYLTDDPVMSLQRLDEANYYVKWTEVISAEDYHLQEATAPSFEADVRTFDDWLTGTSRPFNKDGEEGTYYYRVQAASPDVDNLSRWSNVLSVTVPLPAAASGEAASQAAALSADAAITVQVRIDDGSWHTATVSETAWGAEWSYVWSPLPEGRNTQYAIQARATEGAEFDGPVDAVTVTLDNKDYVAYLPMIFKRWPPVPYPPTLAVSGLEDGVDEDGQYALSWSYSDDVLAVPDPISYTLQESTDPNFGSWTEYPPVNNTSREFTDKDDATYYYRVRGINDYGAGEWSNIVSVAVASADFYDDFNSASSGWITHDAACCLSGCDDGIDQDHPNYKYNLFYADGKYHVKIPLDCRGGGNHGDTRHIYPVTFAPDFERPTTRTCIELKGGFEKWDPTWSFWGLVFAASKDKSKVWSLEVNNLGDWAVVRRSGYDFPGPNAPWQNENRSYPVSYTGGKRWPARPAFEKNTLRARVSGDNVKLYINGVLVDELSRSEISDLNQVGIIGGDWEITPTQIGYDYFYVDEGCDDF